MPHPSHRDMMHEMGVVTRALIWHGRCDMWDMDCFINRNTVCLIRGLNEYSS